MAFGYGKEVLDHAETQVPRRPRRIEREVGAYDVERSLVECEDVLRDRPGRDLKVEIGESRASLPQHLLGHWTRTDGDGPKLEHRSLLRGVPSRALQRPVGELDDEPRLFEEALALGGETDRPGAAVEQLDAQ